MEADRAIRCPECGEDRMVAEVTEVRTVEIGMSEWMEDGGFSYFPMGPVADDRGVGEFMEDSDDRVYCHTCGHETSGPTCTIAETATRVAQGAREKPLDNLRPRM